MKSLSERLGEIIAQADGGCGPCVSSLSRKIKVNLPEIQIKDFKKGLLNQEPYWSEEIDEWFEDAL